MKKTTNITLLLACLLVATPALADKKTEDVLSSIAADVSKTDKKDDKEAVKAAEEALKAAQKAAEEAEKAAKKAAEDTEKAAKEAEKAAEEAAKDAGKDKTDPVVIANPDVPVTPDVPAVPAVPAVPVITAPVVPTDPVASVPQLDVNELREIKSRLAAMKSDVKVFRDEEATLKLRLLRREITEDDYKTQIRALRKRETYTLLKWKKLSGTVHK